MELGDRRGQPRQGRGRPLRRVLAHVVLLLRRRQDDDDAVDDGHQARLVHGGTRARRRARRWRRGRRRFSPVQFVQVVASQ